MADLIRRLHELLGRPRGKEHSDTQDQSIEVDAEVLEELLRDTYQNAGFENSPKVANRILDMVNQYATGKSPPKDVSDSVLNGETKAESKGESAGSDSPVSEPAKVPMAVFEKFVAMRTQKLGEVFQRLDRDNDKKVSLDDVYTYLDHTGLDYDPAKVDVVFRSVLDHNRDGHVTPDEFIRHLVLVPLTSDQTRFFTQAYKFFVDDLEISADSDVLLSGESGHGLGYFWAGGFAGVVSRTCTAPFDRIKVFLIAQATGKPMSTAQVIRILWKQRGIRAFFVGNGLNVFKVFPESAMKFGGFETAKRIFSALEGVEDPADLSRMATFVAGGIGGMISQLCVYPIDTLKFRVQCETASRGGQSSGVLLNVVRNMWSAGGFRSFYRGLYVGVLGIFPFAAMDLGIFSAFKKAYLARQARLLHIDPSEVQMGNMVVLSMGAISGSVGASVVYPVNLVRTRIQTQGTKGHPFFYKGFIDCCRQTHKREGYRGFFRGLGPNLAKVAPSVSISYVVYENTKRFLGLP